MISYVESTTSVALTGNGLIWVSFSIVTTTDSLMSSGATKLSICGMITTSCRSTKDS